jgi:hypothetical protein
MEGVVAATRFELVTKGQIEINLLCVVSKLVFYFLYFVTEPSYILPCHFCAT